MKIRGKKRQVSTSIISKAMQFFINCHDDTQRAANVRQTKDFSKLIWRFVITYKVYDPVGGN